MKNEVLVGGTQENLEYFWLLLGGGKKLERNRLRSKSKEHGREQNRKEMGRAWPGTQGRTLGEAHSKVMTFYKWSGISRVDL